MQPTRARPVLVRTSALIACSIVVPFTALPAMPDDDPPVRFAKAFEELKWRLEYQEGAKRQEAADELRRLVARFGVDAAPAISQISLQDSNKEAWEAIREGLGASDAAAANAELRSRRSAWPAGGSERIRWLIRELTSRYEPRRSKRFRLHKSNLEDPLLIPIGVTIALLDGTSVGGEPDQKAHRCRIQVGSIGIDTDGDGDSDLSVRSGERRVVHLGTGDRTITLLFFEFREHWYASPCTTFTAVVQGGKDQVQFLDGNDDGRVSGDEDFVRVGNGCFMPMPTDGLLWVGGGPRSCRLEESQGAPDLILTDEDPPRWATKAQAEGLGRMNEWRSEAGLPPVLLDFFRSAECQAHARYMEMNPVPRGNSAGEWHDENPGRPGYTPEGALAGRESSLGPGRGASETVDCISRTCLHRLALIGRGKGIAGVGSARSGSVIWGEDWPETRWDGAILVPGPGQSGVPLQCQAEWPSPDAIPEFYRSIHGYPILIACEDLAKADDIAFDLIQAENEQSVPSTVFSRGRPYGGAWRRSPMALLVADEPLRPNTTYVASVRCRLSGVEKQKTWAFRSGE